MSDAEGPGALELLDPELLADWLAAESEADQQSVLDLRAERLSGDQAALLLALATAGPSYEGDRAQEAALQDSLLSLAAQVAERAGAWAIAAEACRMLAAGAAPASAIRRRWHDAAIRHGRQIGAWDTLYRLESEAAAAAVRARRPREALAALSRALAWCREGAGLALEGDECADALVAMAERYGEPAAAWEPLAGWLEHVRGAGDLTRLALSSARLGRLAIALGNDEQAERRLGEAAAIYGELEDLTGLVTVTMQRAGLAFARGDQGAAVRRAAELLRLRERVEDPALRDLIDEGLP